MEALAGNPKRSADVMFTEHEWSEFCGVMRSLTWGTDVMDRWHRIRESVNQRMRSQKD